MFQTTTATATWECPQGQNQLIKKSLKTGKILTTGKIPVKIQKEFDQWLQSQEVKPNLEKRHAKVNKWKQKLKHEPENKKWQIKLNNSIYSLSMAKVGRKEYQTINYHYLKNKFLS